MRLLGRVFVVFFAFLFASLAAAIMLQIGIMLPFWQSIHSPDINQGFFSVLVGFSFFAISFFALGPAILVIAVAEAFRLRSFLFYGLAGGLEALVLCYSLGFTGRAADAPMTAWFQAFAAAGIVAGLVYWLLAGRNAGRWCESAPAVTRP